MPEVDILASVASYLSALPEREKEEIVSELANHLEDKATALSSQGASPAEAETTAGAVFGDPAEIGARLAAVHRPPSLRLTVFAILPYILNGLLYPAIVFVVAMLDAIGLSAHEPLRILNLQFVREESLVYMAAAVLALAAIYVAGALACLRRLPPWSPAWLGSVLAWAMILVRPVLDKLPPSLILAANLVEMALLILILVVLARRRSGLLALSVAVATLIQGRMFNPVAFLAPPRPVSAGTALLFYLFVLLMVAAACLATVTMLHRPYNRAMLPLLALAAVVSFAPDLLVLLLQLHDLGRVTVSLVAWLYGSILPALLVLVVPYLLGRRRTAAVR